MPTIEVPVKVAQSGVKITTGGLTTIQVRLAAIELLVGGPYTKDGKEHTYGHTEKVQKISSSIMESLTAEGISPRQAPE